MSERADFKRLLISYLYSVPILISARFQTGNSMPKCISKNMPKIIPILFIFLFLLLPVTPVYAGNSFQYLRLIQTDNSLGYKSIVLDQAVYAHSNLLNDLRVINDQDEEVPYLLASLRDASTETEKEAFLLSEEAQYTSAQDGTDSIITIQLKRPNAFRLELNLALNPDARIARTYGLFGVKDQSTHYLSEGELFDPLPSNSSVKQAIEWTDHPLLDKLRLIIHNRDGQPLNLKSVTVKYHLNKLVFKDPGNSQLRLAYGNANLRSPIYEVLSYQAILKNERFTPTELGPEVKIPSQTDTPPAPTKDKLLLTGALTALGLLVFLGVGLRFWTRKRKKKSKPGVDYWKLK
ncbi:MAG: hypothetical protein WA125_08485 [Desulfosporosinus sp.]